MSIQQNILSDGQDAFLSKIENRISDKRQTGKKILLLYDKIPIYIKASRCADFGSRKKNVQLKTAVREVYTYVLKGKVNLSGETLVVNPSGEP